MTFHWPSLFTPHQFFHKLANNLDFTHCWTEFWWKIAVKLDLSTYAPFFSKIITIHIYFLLYSQESTHYKYSYDNSSLFIKTYLISHWREELAEKEMVIYDTKISCIFLNFFFHFLNHFTIKVINLFVFFLAFSHTFTPFHTLSYCIFWKANKIKRKKNN